MLPEESVPTSAGIGAVRVSDEQRRSAEQVLTQHCVAGRMTIAELDDRLAGVWAARYLADLDPLFRDLPPLGQAATDIPSWKGWLIDGRALVMTIPPRRLIMYLVIAVLLVGLLGGGLGAFDHGGFAGGRETGEH
jgi:hypothetical protein